MLLRLLLLLLLLPLLSLCRTTPSIIHIIIAQQLANTAQCRTTATERCSMLQLIDRIAPSLNCNSSTLIQSCSPPIGQQTALAEALL
jgi:hypothetical protein